MLITLRSDLPRLEALLKEQEDPGRNLTARRVCQEFGFIDPRGCPRQAGCLNALRTLDAKKHIKLPPDQAGAPTPKPRLLDAPVPEGKDVPDSAREVQVSRSFGLRADRIGPFGTRSWIRSIRGARPSLRVLGSNTSSTVPMAISAP